jgi:hypothetical protein
MRKTMKKIPKREYAAEFKEQAVKQVEMGEVDWFGSEGTGTG